MDRNRHIRTVEDVMALLDELAAPVAGPGSEGAERWWDGFYEDRSRAVPFFVAKPDESLAGYVEDGPLTTPGRALDLGCGPGRNALHLAARGWRVDAVDLSAEALAWAEERARESGVADRIRFLRADAFTLSADDGYGPYDLVHDSGCFHHLPPHRRVSHLALLDRVLAPGGHFSLACFAAGKMGSELPDAALYRDPAAHGGLAYTADELRAVFADMEEIELRPMADEPAHSPRFGEPFLWAGLFRRAVTGALE